MEKFYRWRMWCHYLCDRCFFPVMPCRPLLRPLRISSFWVEQLRGVTLLMVEPKRLIYCIYIYIYYICIYIIYILWIIWYSLERLTSSQFITVPHRSSRFIFSCGPSGVNPHGPNAARTLPPPRKTLGKKMPMWFFLWKPWMEGRGFRRWWL